MAAGLGFIEFTTGDILTAASANGYLASQTVMVFADSAARTTAITSPQEGMISYLKSTDAVEKYNGSAWISVAGAPSPLTTKGDLYTYSTTDARLAVGTNGHVLTADSTAATGIKWAAQTLEDKSCRVYQTAATTLSTSFTSLAMGAEDFDTDAMHDNSTNNTRITIKTAGKYLIGGAVQTGSNTALGVRIFLNGTTQLVRIFQGNSGVTEGASLSTIYDFALNDFVELQAATGTSIGAVTSADSNTQFWAVKV